MATLDLNSLKNLQNSKSSVPASSPVPSEPVKTPEVSAVAEPRVSAGSKISLSALRKSSGLSPVGSEKPVEIAPVLEKTEEPSIETVSIETPVSDVPEIAPESGIEATDTDRMTEEMPGIHTTPAINQEIISELASLVGIEESADPVSSESLDATTVFSETAPSESVVDSSETTPSESNLPSEFFPKLNVVEDFGLQDVLGEIVDDTKIQSHTEAVTEGESSEVLTKDAESEVNIEAVAEIPTTVESVEAIETNDEIVESDRAEKSSILTEPEMETETFESVVTPETWETLQIADTEDMITPEYVEQVKNEISSERKGGLRFFKNSRVVVGLSVFAVFSVGFSFLAFGFFTSHPGKSNIQEIPPTPVLESTGQVSETEVTMDTEPENEITDSGIHIADSGSTAPIYQEWVDYTVIFNTKKKHSTASSSTDTGAVTASGNELPEEVSENGSSVHTDTIDSEVSSSGSTESGAEMVQSLEDVLNSQP